MKTGIGIIGCGNISEIYFQNLTQNLDGVKLIACADLDHERAKAKAEAHGVLALSVEELLAHDDISIVVNLTIPQAHFSVAKACLEAGKSVHNEKPLTLSREEGKELVELAAAKGLRLGCAPDTFLGGGIQTCLELIQRGEIGEIVGAQAFMFCPGHESWHPDPEFYYKAGGGPMFDMGPYYLTALVALLGPVEAVTGMTQISFPQRTITSEKKNGQKIDVDVPTHVTGSLKFKQGAIGTIVTSFDVQGSQVPNLEIFGSKATLSVPDPNGFGGPVKILRPGKGWEEVEIIRPHTENSRGLGPADMAAAITENRPHRASGDLALHVLDIMHGIHESSDQGRQVRLTTDCLQPAPMP